MKKFTLLIITLLLLINFSIVEYETFENTHNGYRGLLVTLDEPVRKVFEKINLQEIELPNKFLISFNTFEY